MRGGFPEAWSEIIQKLHSTVGGSTVEFCSVIFNRGVGDHGREIFSLEGTTVENFSLSSIGAPCAASG